MGLNMLAKAAQQRTDDVVAVPLAQITFDTKIQSREGLNTEKVNEYEASFREHGWGNFPPISLYDDGEIKWIGDGNHRYAAASQAGLAMVPARIKTGTRRDAILHAASANHDHGLPRTNADKRRSVTLLLLDEEWRTWSDHQVAQHCHVDHKTVGKIRSELESTGEIPSETVRNAKHGSGSRKVDTTNIGNSNKKSTPAQPAPAVPAPEPTAEPDLPRATPAAAPAPQEDDFFDPLKTHYPPPSGPTLDEMLRDHPEEVKAATFTNPPQAEQPATQAVADEALTDDDVLSIIDAFFEAYQVLIASEEAVTDYMTRHPLGGPNRASLIELIFQDFHDNVEGQD